MSGERECVVRHITDSELTSIDCAMRALREAIPLGCESAEVLVRGDGRVDIRFLSLEDGHTKHVLRADVEPGSALPKPGEILKEFTHEDPRT